MTIISNSNTLSDGSEGTTGDNFIVVIIVSDSTTGNSTIEGSSNLVGFETPSIASIEMELERFDSTELDLIEEYIRKSKKPKKIRRVSKKKRVRGPQLIANTRQMRYRKPM